MSFGIPWEVALQTSVSGSRSPSLGHAVPGGAPSAAIGPIAQPPAFLGQRTSTSPTPEPHNSSSAQGRPLKNTFQDHEDLATPNLTVFHQHWNTLRSALADWFLRTKDISSVRIQRSTGPQVNPVLSDDAFHLKEREKWCQTAPVARTLLAAFRRDGTSNNNDSSAERAVFDAALAQLVRVLKLEGLDSNEHLSVVVDVVRTLWTGSQARKQGATKNAAGEPEAWEMESHLESLKDLQRAANIKEFEAQHATMIGADPVGLQLECLAMLERIMLVAAKVHQIERKQMPSQELTTLLSEEDLRAPTSDAIPLHKKCDVVVGALKPIETLLSTKYAQALRDIDFCEEKQTYLKITHERALEDAAQSRNEVQQEVKNLETEWNRTAETIHAALEKLSDLQEQRRLLRQRTVDQAVEASRKVGEAEVSVKACDRLLAELKSAKNSLGSSAELLIATREYISDARARMITPSSDGSMSLEMSESGTGGEIGAERRNRTVSESPIPPPPPLFQPLTIRADERFAARQQQRLQGKPVIMLAASKHAELCSQITNALYRHLRDEPRNSEAKALFQQIESRSYERERLVRSLDAPEAAAIIPYHDAPSAAESYRDRASDAGHGSSGYPSRHSSPLLGVHHESIPQTRERILYFESLS